MKWGIIAAGLGLSLVLIDILPVTFRDAFSYAVMLLLGGAALLLFYWLTSRRPRH